ncbi:MAG: gliding motility-associated C-terminal domain-containing protein, partial [Bacteroidota bacterium]
ISGFTGIDSICIIACDNGTPSLCDTIVIPVTVLSVNHPPVITEKADTTEMNTSITISTTISDIDVGSVFNVTLCGVQNGAATVSVTGNQLCVVYTPNIGFIGLDSICVIACDNDTPSLCDTTIIPVTVISINNPPVIADTTGTTPENIPVTVCTTINDSDTSSIFSVALCGVQNGTATVSVTGDQLCIVYTPNLGFIGIDSICVIACDNGVPSLCDTALIMVTVTPGADTAITVVNIPQGFSPNGDGINDFFEIEGILNYPSNHLMIFNRWGNLVYEIIGYNNNWGGTYEGDSYSNGNELPSGTYFFILKLDGESKPIKKYIYLNR